MKVLRVILILGKRQIASQERQFFCDENELVCIRVIIQRNIHLRPTIAVAIFSVFWWHEDQKTELCISSSKSNLRYFFKLMRLYLEIFCHFFSKRTSFSRIIAQSKTSMEWKRSSDMYTFVIWFYTHPFLYYSPRPKLYFCAQVMAEAKTKTSRSGPTSIALVLW